MLTMYWNQISILSNILKKDVNDFAHSLIRKCRYLDLTEAVFGKWPRRLILILLMTAALTLINEWISALDV